MGMFRSRRTDSDVVEADQAVNRRAGDDLAAATSNL